MTRKGIGWYVTTIDGIEYTLEKVCRGEYVWYETYRQRETMDNIYPTLKAAKTGLLYCLANYK